MTQQVPTSIETTTMPPAFAPQAITPPPVSPHTMMPSSMHGTPSSHGGSPPLPPFDLSDFDLESPRVVVRVGRQGNLWHAVASIETGGGPILVHARADRRVILRALVRNPGLRRWAERISAGKLPPGVLDQIVATVGWGLPNPIRAISRAAKTVTRPLRAAVENVAHAQVLRDVTEKVSRMALQGPLIAQATGLFHIPDTAIQSALKSVTNNPLWDMSRTGVSFIPGVGSAVSSGMAAAAAMGRGASAKDIALAAARGALPGGPLVQTAFDIGVGLAQNKGLEESALNVAHNQIGNLIGDRLGPVGGQVAKQLAKQALSGDPSVGFYQNVQVRRSLGVPSLNAPPAALQTLQSALKAGFMLARTKGRKPNPSNLVAFKRTLPKTPAGAKIARIAEQTMANSHYRAKAVSAYKSALDVLQKLERRDGRAHAAMQKLIAEASKGHPKSRVTLAVLEVVRRSRPLGSLRRAGTPNPSPSTRRATVQGW